MTDINPKNFPGANITVVGTAGGEYEIREFPNGGEQAQLSVAVGKGYKKDGEWVDTGTDWYTLVASPDWASSNWPHVGKGDKVRIDDGRLEARAYLNKDKDARVDLQVRFGTLTVVEAKADRQSNSNDKPF